MAVGASAGGVQALTQMAAGLTEDLPYAVLVVLHMLPSAHSELAKIIDRSGPLPAESAADGAHLEPGRIYVAVPDRQLLVSDDRMYLSEGPSENGHRPAINALFRSVAVNFGPHAIGVLLSGLLDDGVLGAAAIRSRGGSTVVQEPDDALFPALPGNALQAGVVDHRVKAAELGQLLKQLAQREIQERGMEPDARMELEDRIAMGTRFSMAFDSERPGPPSGYTCPDCNGSLITVEESRFRCRVGHAWTADALLRTRDDGVENALWIALRSLQEKAKLSRKLARTAEPRSLALRFGQIADEAERALTVLSQRLSKASAGGAGSSDP